MAEAFSLFFTAFFAATILPLSSEVALLAALNLEMEPSLALVSASLGNVLALIANYFIGLLICKKSYKKLQSSKIGNLTLQWFKRYGTFTLPLTVLPIIGDPLTIIAGIYKINFVIFFFITASLRVIRYVIIVYTFT